MGEAKRRRDAADAPTVQYRDLVTNEMRTARNGGDPVEFISQLLALTGAEKRGERPEAKVRCDGCTACCYYHHVDVTPAQERPEDLAYLALVPAATEGQFILQKRPDGACVHLTAQGCSVYSHRPQACRRYDCRTASLVSMVDTFDGGRKSPVWMFAAKTQHGEMVKEACRMLATLCQAEAKQGGNPRVSREATTAYVMERLDATVEWIIAVRERVARLPPAERAAAVAQYDEEKYRQSVLALIGDNPTA